VLGDAFCADNFVQFAEATHHREPSLCGVVSQQFHEDRDKDLNTLLFAHNRRNLRFFLSQIPQISPCSCGDRNPKTKDDGWGVTFAEQCVVRGGKHEYGKWNHPTAPDGVSPQ
jgi:hypothetical protein